MIAKSANEIDVAIELISPIIIEARKISVVVPRSAPNIKGIAFFSVIRRETAKGTKSPIVILDENKIPVIIAPTKYALYFDSKNLFMNILAFFLLLELP